jgi:uridine kinase
MSKSERWCSYDELQARALAYPRRGATLLLGIDGPGGSGKSTIASALARTGPYPVVAVDDFYRPSAERNGDPVPQRRVGAEFDLDRLERQVLVPLGMGRPARYQRYDWPSDRLDGWIEVRPGGFVILVGIYVMSRGLAAYLDVCIWVECPREVRLRRGLARDGDDARERWVNDWMPREDEYVARETPKNRADFVVMGGDHAELAPSERVLVLETSAR